MNHEGSPPPSPSSVPEMVPLPPNTDSSPVVRTCPLCGSIDGDVLETVDYARIWTALEQDFSPGFAPAVIARHTPAPETALRECRECGLRYFTPSMAGDQEFYERLMASKGYVEDRWEFERVSEMLRPDDAVIDIGCGTGAFLLRI